MATGSSETASRINGPLPGRAEPRIAAMQWRAPLARLAYFQMIGADRDRTGNPCLAKAFFCLTSIFRKSLKIP
jgi:hypothetical protein